MTPLVSKKTILIVDDEPLILETMGMMLELDGHTVEVASDGEAALKKLAIHNFDIVFTDFTMPKMSGNLLAIAIKKKTPQQIIVMVTGMAECLATKDGEQTSTPACACREWTDCVVHTKRACGSLGRAIQKHTRTG